MTDSDTINPFEAPKQLVVSADPTITDPIRYEATPTIVDLNSALRPVASIVTSVILLSITVFGFAAISVGIVTQGLQSGNQLFGMFASLMFGSLTALHLFSKIYAGKIHLRSQPNATEQLTGNLTSEGLLLQSENSISWQAHCGLLSCHKVNQQLVLCHDPRGVILKILPIRGFAYPSQAIQFLDFQANNVSEPLDMRDPLVGPSMIGDQPAEAIVFDGIVKAGDREHSPLATRKTGGATTRLLIVSAIVLPVIAFVGSLMWMLIVAIALFLLRFLSILNSRSSLNSIDPELDLISIQGWLSEHEVALLHNVGQSRSGWQEFRSLGFNEACIWLQTYGGEDRFVLLPRRFFGDETQWQAAVDIVASHAAK